MERSEERQRQHEKMQELLRMIADEAEAHTPGLVRDLMNQWQHYARVAAEERDELTREADRLRVQVGDQADTIGILQDRAGAATAAARQTIGQAGRPMPMPAGWQIEQTDPYRVEIKENSKGEPQISVRATAETMIQAVEHTITLYRNTEKRLGESAPHEPINRTGASS